MAQTQLTLGKICAACGKERKGKLLMYDPATFTPYCANPYICCDEHPNSPGNLIERQKEFKLVDADTANEAFKKHLLDVYEDKSVVESIQKLLVKPITIRILTPEMAKFLIDYAEEHGIENQSEAIRSCIQTVMENRGQFVNEYREEKVKKKKIETAKSVVDKLDEPDETPEPPSGNFGTF